MVYMKSSGLFLSAILASIFFCLPVQFAVSENIYTSIERIGGENPPAVVRITADIPKTEVYIDGRYEGLVPVTLDPAPPGIMQVSLLRDGYHPETFTITAVPGERTRIRVEMRPRTGDLSIENAPDNAVFTIPGTGTYQPGMPLPEGEYPLQITAFGYISKTIPVYIAHGKKFVADGSLQKAAFSLVSFKAQERSYNPESNEPFIFTITATAAGTARIVITDVEDREVYAIDDVYIDSRTITVRWNGSDDAGRLLPDGLYSAILTVKPAEESSSSQEAPSATVAVYLDRSIVYRSLSVLSGTGTTGPVISGTLMPPSTMAVSLYSHFGEDTLIPGISCIAGITRNLEAGAMAEIPVTRDGTSDIDFTLSVKTGFSSTLHSVALYLAYHHSEGVIVGPAYELRAGPVSIGINLEASIRDNGGILYKPDVYAAGGAAFRFFYGPATLGLWIRTETSLVTSDIVLDDQLSAGVMLKLIIPGTDLFISGDGAISLAKDSSNNTFSGTAGFGVFF